MLKENKGYYTILKLGMVLLPFYFIFFGPLHHNAKNPEIKVLWKYLYVGFAFYTLIILYFIIKGA
jgi:hypothetical protein